MAREKWHAEIFTFSSNVVVPPFSLKACKREVGGEYLYSKNAYWDCEKLLPPGQIQLGHPGVFSKGYILLPDSVKVSSVI